MPDKRTKQKLNPEIVDIEVGVRSLRKITFYPLSAADQLKMTKILEEVFEEMVEISIGGEDKESLVVFFKKILEIVRENINVIIAMVCDEEPDELLTDLTNSQLTKIIEYVYVTNFEGPLKNLVSLFQKGGESEDWMKLVSSQFAQPSVKSTDTDSKTSTEKVIEKEASPTDK